MTYLIETWGALILYIAAIVFVAWYYSRGEVKSLSDYYIAGGRLSWVVTAVSWMAITFSASGFVGNPGTAFGMGYSMLWLSPLTIVVALIGFLLFAPRYRVLNEALGALTVPEFIAKAYRCRIIQPLAGILIFVLVFPYAMAIYKGVGVLMEATLGIPFVYAVILTGVIVAFYAAYGGQFSVSYTDLLQGILWIIMLIVILPLFIMGVGGLGATESILAAKSPQYLEFPGPWGLFSVVGILLVFSLGNLGQPQLITKWATIENRRSSFARAALLAAFLFAITQIVINYAGVMARAAFPDLPTPDQAMPTLVISYLPGIVQGLVTAGVLAATMSTTDSVLIMASSNLLRDLGGHVKSVAKMSDESLIKWARVITVIVGLACTAIALSPPPWLHALTIYVWGTMTAAFVAPILYVLYWRDKMTPAAGFAGVFGGAGTAIIWQELGRPGGVHPLISGLIVAFLIVPIVAAATRKKRG